MERDGGKRVGRPQKTCASCNLQGLAGPRFATLTRQAPGVPSRSWMVEGGEGFKLVKENLRLKFNEPRTPPDITGHRNRERGRFSRSV